MWCIKKQAGKTIHTIVGKFYILDFILPPCRKISPKSPAPNKGLASTGLSCTYFNVPNVPNPM